MTRLLTFFCVALLSVQAWAAPAIDQAGADALKPRFVEMLGHYEASLKKDNISLRREGQLLVEPAGSYYAVTTPSLTLVLPNGNTRTLGMIAINTIPTDDPDLFKVALALPTPMIENDAGGKQVGALSIGRQTMNGLWSMKAGAFMSLNADYKDVHMVNAAQGTDITIPSLVVMADMKEDGPNLWSGPTELDAGNITIKDAKGGMTIGSVRGRTSVDKMDMIAQKEFEQRVRSAAPALAAQTNDNAMRETLMKTMVGDYFTRFANGMDATIAVNDIRFQTAPTPQNKAQTGSIQSIKFSGSTSALRSNAAGLSWNLSADGVKVDDPEMAKYVPTQILLKGNGVNIPFQTLLKTDAQTNMSTLFSQAGTRLTIENILADAPAFGVDAKGQFQASPTAALGAAGNMKIAVRGLKDLLGWLSTVKGPAAIGAPTVPPQFLAGLAMIEMVGQQGNDNQGRALRTYDITFSPDGKVLLNGTDLGAMMQTMKVTPTAPR